MCVTTASADASGDVVVVVAVATRLVPAATVRRVGVAVARCLNMPPRDAANASLPLHVTAVTVTARIKSYSL